MNTYQIDRRVPVKDYNFDDKTFTLVINKLDLDFTCENETLAQEIFQVMAELMCVSLHLNITLDANDCFLQGEIVGMGMARHGVTNPTIKAANNNQKVSA